MMSLPVWEPPPPPQCREDYLSSCLRETTRRLRIVPVRGRDREHTLPTGTLHPGPGRGGASLHTPLTVRLTLFRQDHTAYGRGGSVVARGQPVAGREATIISAQLWGP